MMGSRQTKSGQAIIFLMVVMVIGILAVVWSYDLHRVVNAKLRMRSAGDAAALSAARWQGYTLNMIGDLNLIQAAVIALYVEDAELEEEDQDGDGVIDTPPEAYELHELRARLDFVGPLAAFAIAQQAAFNNGALPDPALAENLLRMAADYRDELGWNPYDNAREEYADLLENLAVRGVAVSSYGLQLPRHPLVQEQFYSAVAQALADWWCPMYSYKYQMENYDGYESWSKLDLEELKYRQIMDLQLDDFWNVDASGNFVMPSSAVPDEDDYLQEMGEYLAELEFTEDYGGGTEGFYGAEAPWHVYNNSWTKRWPKAAYYNDETKYPKLNPLAIYDNVKPQYNYLGAVAGVSMSADVHRGILSSSGNENVDLSYKAKAKVFGLLDVPDSSVSTGGGLFPPHYFGFVFPCFQNVRLVHSDIGEKQISDIFYDHITRHLEPYLNGGPEACDPECRYCRLLIEWKRWIGKQGWNGWTALIVMSKTIPVIRQTLKKPAPCGAMLGEVPPVDRNFKNKSRSGQAMSELLVGLVAILLLIVGLQQISIVSRESFATYVDVRADLAGQLADPMSDFSGEYIFAQTVDRGEDEKNYTGDDFIVEGDDSFYSDGKGFLHMVDYTILEDYLWDYEREVPYYRLSDSSVTELSESFSMHYAVGVREVETVPFLRKILGRDTIYLKREAWMPAWDGLMEIIP